MVDLAARLQGVPDEEVVGELMQFVLDEIVVTYEEANVSLPDRRYLHVGSTVHDCEQVTVQFIQMFLGTPGARADQVLPCTGPRSVILAAQVVRRVALPSGARGTTPPSAESLTSHTVEKMRDSWLLMDAMKHTANEYMGGVLMDVSVTPVQGEYQAVSLNITVGIP